LDEKRATVGCAQLAVERIVGNSEIGPFPITVEKRRYRKVARAVVRFVLPFVR
jgi:hypothetical protein